MINRIHHLSVSPFDKFEVELKNKNIAFWRCFLPENTDPGKKSIKLDLSLDIDERGVLEVIHLRNKENVKGVKLQYDEEWESDDEETEGNDLGLSNLFGKIQKNDFEGGYVSLDDLTGEKFMIHHVSLLDYYVLFRSLGMYGEAEFVRKKLFHIKRIEILLFLFLKCVRLYENEKVKELFLRRVSKKKRKRKKRENEPSQHDSHRRRTKESMLMKELNLQILGLHHEQLRSKRVINFETSFASTLFHILQISQGKLRNPRYLEHIFHFLDLLGYSKSKSDEENILKGSQSIMVKLYNQLENRTTERKTSPPEYFHNLILVSKEKTKFYVHKEVVAQRSQYFFNILFRRRGEPPNDNEVAVPEILEVDLYDADVHQLVRYFYTSVLELKDVGENNDFESFLRLFVFAQLNNEDELMKLFTRYIKALIFKIPRQSLRENFLRFGHILRSDRLRKAFVKKCCSSYHEEGSLYLGTGRLGRGRTMRYITMSAEMNEIDKKIQKLTKDNLHLEESSKKLREENEDLKRRIEEIRKEKGFGK